MRISAPFIATTTALISLLLVGPGVAQTDDGAQTVDSVAFNQSVIARSNALRANHGAPPLVFDEALARRAETRARERCAEAPSHGTPLYSPGENVAYSWGGTDALASEAVEKWYEDGATYDYSWSAPPANTGHFTQLIWRASTAVGCAVCVSDDERVAIGVCRYAQAGNVQGQFGENVLPPRRTPETQDAAAPE